MATANSTTSNSSEGSPNTDVFSLELSDIAKNFDLSRFSNDEAFQLACLCEEANNGLCHNLHFLGKLLLSYAQKDNLLFSQESLSQLGHSLNTTSQLLSFLTQLQTKADSQLMKTSAVAG